MTHELFPSDLAVLRVLATVDGVAPVTPDDVYDRIRTGAAPKLVGIHTVRQALTEFVEIHRYATSTPDGYVITSLGRLAWEKK